MVTDVAGVAIVIIAKVSRADLMIVNAPVADILKALLPTHFSIK